MNELDEPVRISDSEGRSESESGSGEVGSDWNWPPWKNIPQRYKLIGTTSLAFIICNMDKVIHFAFLLLGICSNTLDCTKLSIS